MTLNPSVIYTGPFNRNTHGIILTLAFKGNMRKQVKIRISNSLPLEDDPIFIFLFNLTSSFGLPFSHLASMQAKRRTLLGTSQIVQSLSVCIVHS